MTFSPLAITMGDASGIGPEVILKALQTPLPQQTRPIVYGDHDVLVATERHLLANQSMANFTPLSERLVVIEHPTDALDAPDAIGVINVVDEHQWDTSAFGEAHPDCAHLQLRALQRAMDDAEGGHVCGIATAPWTKHLFSLIDAPTYGHTEVLAERFNAPHHVMMLAGDRLRVALTTVHVPLQRVSEVLTPLRLQQTIETTIADLRRFYGILEPKIAVCGLNPHAGEHGVMGTEEGTCITPVIEAMRQKLPKATIEGPFASDTLFAKFRTAAPYDAVICMYHDQGLIPLKLLHFGQSANITLGLPIVRTSVDHGTAYDIAGQGIADGGSMKYAMALAIELAMHRNEEGLNHV